MNGSSKKFQGNNSDLDLYIYHIKKGSDLVLEETKEVNPSSKQLGKFLNQID